MIEMMVSVALAVWATFSVFLSPPISIERETTPSFPHAYAFAVIGWLEGEISTCAIYINPDGDFDALPLEQQQAVVTHEVGHCLGLRHIGIPGLMFRAPLYYGGEITEADVAECHRAHPVPPVLPYRAVVSVAHD